MSVLILTFDCNTIPKRLQPLYQALLSIEYQKAFQVHLHLKDMTIHVYCNKRFFNTKTTATTLSRCVISIVQCNSRAFTSLRWRPLKCQFYKFPVAYTCNLQWTTKNRILIKILKSLKVLVWLIDHVSIKHHLLANHVIG